VAVPCYRERARVPALAAALQRLDPAPAVLLAVDDGSDDGTGEALREAGFELLTHPENLGLGAARNTLWRAVEQRGLVAVAYLDADVEPAPDFLRRVAEGLREDRAAGVGGRNEDGDGDGGEWIDAWRARFWRQDLGERLLIDAPMLVGACAAYRVAALRDVGGWDSRFRTHGEDVDLGRRLRAAGHRLRYDPEIVVRHRRRDTATSLLRMCFLHCREGMRATLGTPGEEPRPDQLVLGMAKKAASAPAAALMRRHDPREAALGLAACSAGLLGYAVAWLRR
jgi:GT2 family glycosyltransferase